jgi:hypothetical protein
VSFFGVRIPLKSFDALWQIVHRLKAGSWIYMTVFFVFRNIISLLGFTGVQKFQKFTDFFDGWKFFVDARNLINLDILRQVVHHFKDGN